MSYAEVSFIIALLVAVLVTIILMTINVFVTDALAYALFIGVGVFIYFDKEFDKIKDWYVLQNDQSTLSICEILLT